jgi:Porin subfamily
MPAGACIVAQGAFVMRRSAVVLHSIALAFACTFILLFLISSASAKNPPPLNRGLPDSVLVKDPKHPNGPKIFLAPPECTECTKIYNQLKTALESFYSLQYADAQETGTEGNVDAAGNSSAAKRALTALGTITSTTDTDGLNKVQNGAKPQDVKDFPKNAKGLEKTINDLIKALKDCEDSCNKKKASANQPQTTPTEKPAEPPKKEEPKKEEPKKEEPKKTEETTEWAKPPTEHPTTLIGWRGLQKQAKDEIANGSPYKSEWEKLLKEAETAIEKLNEEGGYYRPLQKPGTPSVSNVGFQGGTLTLPSAAASPGAGYVNVCSLYGSGFYHLPGTDTCVKIGGWNPAGTTLFVEGGIGRLPSTMTLGGADSGSAGGFPVPLTSDAIFPHPASASATAATLGVVGSFNVFNINLAPPPPPPPPPAYAPEDKPASGFPAVLPTKALPKPPAPPPQISVNAGVGIFGFFGGKSTINGIPGGPGITPTGTDSFNFRDNFMVTAGAAVVVPVTASVTAAITGGFAGVDKTATFNCVTYCVNGVPVPAFSASKDVFLPGAYLGGRVQWPIAIPGFPGAAFFLQYKHVFVPSENMSLGSVAQGRIVSFNVSQDLDLVTAGLAIPLH